MWSSDDEWLDNISEITSDSIDVSHQNINELKENSFKGDCLNTNNQNCSNIVKNFQKSSDDSNSNSNQQKSLFLLELNDNKAGMESLDKDTINKIIHETSKGSRFYENELKRERQMKARVTKQEEHLNKLSSEDIKCGRERADEILKEYESKRDLSRTIVHVDMDMFFAAVEMRDDPTLLTQPMAVGGSSMLSTSNYIARRYGVRAAMPGFIAKKLCPQLIIIPSHFEKYSSVSKEVQEIFKHYDPNFAMMSLDEGYLDFTDHLIQRSEIPLENRTFEVTWERDKMCYCPDYRPKYLYDSSEEKIKVSNEIHYDVCPDCKKRIYNRKPFHNVTFGIDIEEAVRELRFKIEQITHLTASAGIAPNCLLSKITSDMNKPNGQYILKANKNDILKFMSNLPIRKVSGIGKVCEQLLAGIGIKMCEDLYSKRGELYHISPEISFKYYMRVYLGISSNVVESSGERKSLSIERTFRTLCKPKDLYDKCDELCKDLVDDLKSHKIIGKTVTLKTKSIDFMVTNRAKSLSEYTDNFDIISKAAKELLKHEINNGELKLRLMGVRMSNFGENMGKKQQNIKDLLLNIPKNKMKTNLKLSIISDKSNNFTSFAKKRKSKSNNSIKEMFKKQSKTNCVQSDDDDIVVIYDSKNNDKCNT